jgi:hypothetical protein
MAAKFTKKTVDTLAKRARYLCSNPDCKAPTVGPNTDPHKATIIGEAAHIRGANPGSARYDDSISDEVRSDITNGIWLCGNCHTLIDRDGSQYSAELLFAWREEHEKNVLRELGNKTEQLIEQKQAEVISKFSSYPPIIRRIIIDRPPYWEYRLTAEFMRFLNAAPFRKIEDLRNQLYYSAGSSVGMDEIDSWISARLSDCVEIIQPIANLISRLNHAWGEPGEAGSVNEIHHVCCLIRDSLDQVVSFEELIQFTQVPDEYEKTVELLKGNLAIQIEKLKSIPDDLQEIVQIALRSEEQLNQEPLVFNKTITFEMPAEWVQDFKREMKHVYSKRKHEIQKTNNQETGCCSLCLLGGVLFIVITIILASVL